MTNATKKFARFQVFALNIGLAFTNVGIKINFYLSTEKRWQEFVVDDVLPFAIQDSL